MDFAGIGRRADTRESFSFIKSRFSATEATMTVVCLGTETRDKRYSNEQQ